MPQLELQWERASRSGAAILQASVDDRVFALHSRYDPEKEAAKIAASMEDADCYILLGDDGGYAAEALRAAKPMARSISYIEFIPAVYAAWPQRRNDRDAAVRRYLADGDSDCVAVVAQCYQAHFFPRLRVYCGGQYRQLCAALGIDPERAVAAAVEALQNDFVTQSRFGKRWLYNIVCNLAAMESRPNLALPVSPVMAVVGAGPSAESQAGELRALAAAGCKVWAADACLEWCRRLGVPVDAAFSIDGQSVSYVHLLRGRAGACVVDVASHPVYARACDSVCFVASAHPLLEYARSRGAAWPRLETAGGNVGQAMAAMAAACGVSVCHAFGLDFAVQAGKPYLRPSFLYHDSDQRQHRLSPYEQLMGRTWLGQESIALSGTWSRTPQLERYATAFRGFAARSDCPIVSHSPCWEGAPAAARPASASALSAEAGACKRASPAATARTVDFMSLFAGYAKELGELKTCGRAAWDIYRDADDPLYAVVLSLLPLQAWYTAFLLKWDPECTDIPNEALALAVRHSAEILAAHFSIEV